MYRSHLPAAEEVFDPGSAAPAPYERGRGRERDDYRNESRGETRGTLRAESRGDSRDESRGEPRGGKNKGLSGDSVWFRLNVGRQQNADPRWLIPMICRQGKITKQEIGAIRIFERESRFEIDSTVAERFIASVGQVPKGEVRIDPLGDAPHSEGEVPAPRTAEPRTARITPKADHKSAAPRAPRPTEKSTANKPVVKNRWKTTPGERPKSKQK